MKINNLLVLDRMILYTVYTLYGAVHVKYPLIKLTWNSLVNPDMSIQWDDEWQSAVSLNKLYTLEILYLKENFFFNLYK